MASRPVETNRHYLDLRKLAGDAAAQVRVQWPDEATIVVEGKPGSPMVSGNRLQLEKAFLNLLRNALEAMAESGPGERRIAIALEEAGDVPQVSICNSGPGLTDTVLERLFYPFVTTKPKGIGMGLAISKALVEANGGRQWHQPRDGGGACFCFTVPSAD